MIKNKKGFTLIELIVTIAIVAVVGFFIMSIVSPAFRFFAISGDKTQIITLCNGAMTAIRDEVRMAEEVSIADSGAVTSPYIKMEDENKIMVRRDGEEKTYLLNETFFAGYQVDVEFSKNAYQSYGNEGKKDVLFIKIVGKGAEGETIETMYSSVDLPNLKGEIGGASTGDAIHFSLPSDE